jgi:ribosomal-protein-alanine N-acetyltransferase
MGRHATFAVVAGDAGPIGLIQIWAIEPDFSTAEWGFVFGESVWGKGFFHQSACLLLDFAFDVLGALRVEARCAQDNARGHAALERLGAVREGNLRLAFRRGNRRLDYVMWSILDCEWRDRRRRAAPCRLVTSCR